MQWIDPLGLAKKKGKESTSGSLDSKDGCGELVRMRHYTSVSKAKKIMEIGMILPGEHFRVYLEHHLIIMGNQEHIIAMIQRKNENSFF
ncbi:hypothetical protein V8J88_05505 [Massilia sp. W12]|uniref:hypothetical protein n=1 Tax=Massilia sp. W12 TaxID=3126507 RepID=UPI0030D473F6